jgi:acetone carboxylase, gamma subunit
MARPSYPSNVITDLITSQLPWEQTKRIMSDYKDADRFDKYIAVLQASVQWKEQILLPIGEHLYIVQKSAERVVKCDCGQEFGDYHKNWKLSALIRVRNTQASLEPIYSGPRKPDPKWMEIREYLCPNCATLLEVEAVPPGWPVIFDFLPDLESFYEEWLGRPLPNG